MTAAIVLWTALACFGKDGEPKWTHVDIFSTVNECKSAMNGHTEAAGAAFGPTGTDQRGCFRVYDCLPAGMGP